MAVRTPTNLKLGLRRDQTDLLRTIHCLKPGGGGTRHFDCPFELGHHDITRRGACEFF